MVYLFIFIHINTQGKLIRNSEIPSQVYVKYIPEKCCRLPFWPYVKLLFCMWLVLPIFNGAAYIYENYVRQYVKMGLSVNHIYPESHRKVLQMMSLDARKSVERYIERYGPEAFARVVRAVRRIILSINFYRYPCSSAVSLL